MCYKLGGMVLAAAMVLGATVPSAAVAETWNWVLETHGANVSWTSPTAVSTNWSDYVYSAEYAKIEFQLGGALWLDVTKEFGDTKTSGIAHALPFDIYKDHVWEPGVFEADFMHWVDAGGSGRWAISNVNFGSLLGNPITAFRSTGTTTVVPEPSTLVLLGAGAIGLLARAWRRRKAV